MVDRSNGGPDASFSLEPNELRGLREALDSAHGALGKVDAIDFPKRQGHQHSRSLYYVNDVDASSVVAPGDIRSIRPGFGLDPNMKGSVIGKILTSDVKRGDRVSLDNLASNV
jgi:sialic acid synthase SpsE